MQQQFSMKLESSGTNSTYIKSSKRRGSTDASIPLLRQASEITADMLVTMCMVYSHVWWHVDMTVEYYKSIH